MAVDLPETTKVLGTRSVWVVPEATITNPAAISAVTLTGGFKATCFIYGDGGVVTGEQARGQSPAKLCEVDQREQLGRVSKTISDIQYSYKPQADDTDPANAARAALVAGSRVYIVDRLGVTDETAPAAGQFVNATLVTLGIQNKTKTGDDEYAEYSITQGASVEETNDDVVLVA